MKEEIVNERQCETEDEKIDIQQLLFKYIIHWPWFVGAVLVCLIGAWIYLRMATPVYNISIIRKSKFPQNPKRSVRFSGKRTKRSVQKRKARNTQKAETKVL